MGSPTELLGLAVIVLVHAAIAALGTRFLRVRMQTRIGSAVYTLTMLPVLLIALTLVFGGILGLGPDLGGPAAVLGVTVLLPLTVGVSFDYFWMPAPEEVDLPAAREESRRTPPRSRRR